MREYRRRQRAGASLSASASRVLEPAYLHKERLVASSSALVSASTAALPRSVCPYCEGTKFSSACTPCACCREPDHPVDLPDDADSLPPGMLLMVALAGFIGVVGLLFWFWVRASGGPPTGESREWVQWTGGAL